MSEFEESTYQSAPEVTNEPSIEQPQAPVEPESTPQENVFTVKYNKEEVQVPYEQAPDYIQKGLNYEKVQTRATEYEQHLNRIAQLSGYQTHDELIEAVAEAERQQERQQYEEAGIDPDKFNQLIEKHPDIQFAREQRAKQEADARFNSEVNAFFEKHPDIKPNDIPNEVWAIREQEGLPLIHAYRSHMFDNVRQQSEQAAIQKLQQNNLTSPGSLSGGDVSHKTNVSSMGKNDFQSLVDKVLRGETKTL
jgi:hypothetical protein